MVILSDPSLEVVDDKWTLHYEISLYAHEHERYREYAKKLGKFPIRHSLEFSKNQYSRHYICI